MKPPVTEVDIESLPDIGKNQTLYQKRSFATLPGNPLYWLLVAFLLALAGWYYFSPFWSCFFWILFGITLLSELSWWLSKKPVVAFRIRKDKLFFHVFSLDKDVFFNSPFEVERSWSHGSGSREAAFTIFLFLLISDKQGNRLCLYSALPPWRSVPAGWNHHWKRIDDDVTILAVDKVERIADLLLLETLAK